MGGVSLIVWDLFVLAVYFENGTYLASVLLNAVWLVTTHIQGYSLWYSFASPIYAAQFRDEKPLRNKLKWVTVGCCCFYVAYGIVMGAFSISGNDDLFNLLTAIGFIIYVYVIFSASCIGILYHIEQLRWLCERVLLEHQPQESCVLAAALPSSSDTDSPTTTMSPTSLKHLELFLKRSRRLKRAVWVFFALFALTAMPFPVAYFILGTFPFSWVFFIVMGFGPPTMCIGYIVFDRPERPASMSTLTLLNSKVDNLVATDKSIAHSREA